MRGMRTVSSGAGHACWRTRMNVKRVIIILKFICMVVSALIPILEQMPDVDIKFPAGD